MRISGRIVAVQEQRFRLMATSGEVYLLTLGREAPLDEATLAELHRRNTNVEVTFRGQPNLTGGVATAVRQVQR